MTVGKVPPGYPGQSPLPDQNLRSAQPTIHTVGDLGAMQTKSHPELKKPPMEPIGSKKSKALGNEKSVTHKVFGDPNNLLISTEINDDTGAIEYQFPRKEAIKRYEQITHDLAQSLQQEKQYIEALTFNPEIEPLD